MMRYLKRVLAVTLMAMASVAGAAAEPAVAKAIREALSDSRPDLKVVSVNASAIDGLFAVQLENGPVIYATADGGHFVVGDLFQVRAGGKGFVNLAEQARNVERAAAVAKIDEADTIAFRPKGKSRAVVHVFTDVDCFYCQKFHAEMAQYNAAGIEVRYLAFPRAGIPSESYNKVATAWCADDRQQAMTRLKQRVPVPLDVCEDNPVADQYALGSRLGVEGTPSMIAPDGTLLPGYLPAPDLARALGIAE